MGKSQKKRNPKENNKKLPVHKRNELNVLIDTLIKLGFKATNNLTDQWKQYVEIRSLLDRVQAIESELKIKNVTGKNRASCIDAFCEWARENGAHFEGIKISEFSGFELGLEALKDFKEGETFITIPKKLLMSLDNVNTSIAPMMSAMPMIQSMSNIKLAFSLLVEKMNPNSFWKPYIDVLPEKYSTVMNFTVAEMQELKGSSALPTALIQCKNIARQYAFINKFIQNIKEEQSDATLNLLKERFTYDLYCWAVSTVMTRQNLIPVDISSNNDEKQNDDGTKPQMSPALIPLWDMANHIQGPLTTGYNTETENIESLALTDYKKGDQIFIFYGNRSNTDLLVHNGFFYPKNSNDSVSIRLGLSQMDELLPERTKLLEALNIQTSGELSVLPPPVCISPELLGFVRVFNMNKDQLQHWIASDRANDLLHVDCALETILETKTWSFLEARLTLLLRAFPTTLDDDLALIKGQAKLGHIKNMLLQFRINEKRILAEALEYVRQRIKT